MDKKTLFVFGTHPTLSLAEVLAWSEAHALSVTVEVQEGSVAIVSGIPNEMRFSLANDLAGVVKVAEVVADHGQIHPKQETEMQKQLFKALSGVAEQQGSMSFGISYYGQPSALPPSAAQERIALEIKKELRAEHGHVRWVSGRGKPLTSVQVNKNKLEGERGVELIVYASKEQCVIATTVAVQPFEDWGSRDFGRPRRNAKQGMLPPKLARMMVNLLGLKPDGILFDPFCGSGTVLMEAALLGWKNLQGSDINVMAVKDTEKNMEWVRSQYSQLEFVVAATVLPLDRQAREVQPNSIRAVVTEPFLGRPLTRAPHLKDVQGFERELYPLYSQLLQFLALSLELNGRAVIVAPAWTVEGVVYSLGDKLSLPAALRPRTYRVSGNKKEQRLLYRRENQFLGREIIVLEKIQSS